MGLVYGGDQRRRRAQHSGGVLKRPEHKGFTAGGEEFMQRKQRLEGDRMWRSKIYLRSQALWKYALVLFLAVCALGFHFLSVQTAASTPVQGGAAAADQRRIPTDRELVDALVVVNRILA